MTDKFQVREDRALKAKIPTKKTVEKEAFVRVSKETRLRMTAIEAGRNYDASPEARRRKMAGQIALDKLESLKVPNLGPGESDSIKEFRRDLSVFLDSLPPEILDRICARFANTIIFRHLIPRLPRPTLAHLYRECGRLLKVIDELEREEIEREIEARLPE